jgi:hypothetical protein
MGTPTGLPSDEECLCILSAVEILSETLKDPVSPVCIIGGGTVIPVVINMFRLPDLLTSDMVVCSGLKLLERLHLAILDVIDNPEKTQQTTAIGTWQKSGLDLAEINYAFWIDKMHELEITINTDARFVVRQTENGWRHLF